jgi:hypothetical protein
VHHARERALKIVLVIVGAAVFGFGLALVDVCQEEACVIDNGEPVCHTRHWLAAESLYPIASPQPDCFHAMVEFFSCRADGNAGISQSDQT